MKFIKAQANGNDFIIIKIEEYMGYDPKYLCDRHYGIGADQILLWQNKGRYYMDIINADGSRSDICVNGLRALGLYLMEIEKTDSITISTRSGDSKIEKHIDTIDALIDLKVSKECIYSVDMHGIFKVYFYHINNPHIIIYNDTKEDTIYKYAKSLENIYSANISFLEKAGDRYYAKVYERGSGWTLSCGSAGLAIFYHLEKYEKIKNIEIEMEGGIFNIKREGKAVRIKGNASIVFTGEI